MSAAPQRGSVLLETVVAMAVLSVCILGIHQSLRQALLNYVLAQDYEEAGQLMRQVAAEQELQPQGIERKKQGAFKAPHDRFQYQYSVKRVDMPPLEFSPRLPPADRALLERSYTDYVGCLLVEISWERAGSSFSVKGETILAPGLLWQPPKAPL